MNTQADKFPARAAAGLRNPTLQTALTRMWPGMPLMRAFATARLPEFEALRDEGKAIKDQVIANLDFYLELFEEKVAAAGGKVHWCENSEDACATIVRLCREAGAHTIAKSKSMIAEEIGLNGALERAGLLPVETDLGEYIIQLRDEAPSHIIAPAIHLNRGDFAQTFRDEHVALDPDRPLATIEDIVREARFVLRETFLGAEAGITGANFLIAESGTVVLVTNEGNADLGATLPRIHIVLASIEKLVPSFEDACVLLRLLARSATGQEISTYTSFFAGPKRAGDLDGPDAFHVVLVDNGRTKLLGTEFQDILRCIRCSACMNHCPVYMSIGGHAYGHVYPGPLGAVLDPALQGLGSAHHLPHASTFCGRCEEVCPVRIPLPKLMRNWRTQDFAGRRGPIASRAALALWGFFARRPSLYRIATRLAGHALGRRGRFTALPFARGWTRSRDFPAPARVNFRDQWETRHEP